MRSIATLGGAPLSALQRAAWCSAVRPRRSLCAAINQAVAMFAIAGGGGDECCGSRPARSVAEGVATRGTDAASREECGLCGGERRKWRGGCVERG